MKRAGLNNQPHHRRIHAKRPKPCGKRSPTWGGQYKLCVLDSDHVGKCQGPIRSDK